MTLEENALRVLAYSRDQAKVQRTRDCIQIDIDGERGVVLLVTAESLEIRLPTVEWTMGAYEPVPTSRLWKRLKWKGLKDVELMSSVR